MTEAADRAGQVLADRYRLIRLVASGGMGEVYEAEHIYIHKRVALKLLRPDLAREVEAVQRLHREAQATSAIGHDNIVKIEDFGYSDDGLVFLAMEWLEGETLAEYLERGPVDLAEGLEIIYQVCKALAAAHATGVVHRDLKPPNIFVLRDEAGAIQVKVVDFGIAKLLFDDAGITQTGMIVGTPHYMAPEQGQGEAVDHRADIYSIGIILYQMAVGEVPFPSSEFFAVLHDHAITKPTSPSVAGPGRGVTPVLEALIMRCLEKEPNDRFQDMVELQRAIDTVRGAQAQFTSRGASAERPRTAARDSLSPPTKQQTAVQPQFSVNAESLDFPAVRGNRNKGLIAAGAIVVAALAGTLSFVALRGGDNPSEHDPKLTAVPPDAAPSLPPDASPRPSRTVHLDDKGTGIEARVTPSPIVANELVELHVSLSPSPALASAVASGRLTAGVQYLYSKDHATQSGPLLFVGGDGRLIEPDRSRLTRDGKYHVNITVRDRKTIVLRATFDVCVGAEPCP